jgi:formylglycine-generating enzyme required for sulfatase activity
MYPWGATDPGTTSQYAIYGCYYPSSSGLCMATVTDIAPVGTATLGAGQWGQLDLAGNLPESTLDWFASPYTTPCFDCTNTSPATLRTRRGAGFGAPATVLVPSVRQSTAPTGRGRSAGFRCARTP